MSNSSESPEPVSKTCRIPQRWVTVAMGFLGLFNAFNMRGCLAMAITEMTLATNGTAMQKSDDLHIKNSSFNNTQLEPANRLNGIRYDWSEKTQGLILSSFYWGYIFSCVLGGVVCQKFGGKHTLGLSILFTALFTVLTPYSVYCGGSTALIVLRIAMGIGEGTMYPAVTHLLAHWIPKDERSMAGCVVFSGAAAGTIFGMFMSGIILQHSEDGWPMVFYFHGTLGVMSFIVNSAFCYSRPSENPYISDEELTYLSNKIDNKQTNLPSTPWRYILKSPAVWALTVGKFGFTWGYATIVSDLPKYMSSVLKFSAEDNGYLSSIPHVVKLICAFVGSWIADKVIAKNVLSVTVVRKIGCTVALTGPAIFLIASFYAGSDRLLAIALQSTGIAFMGCNYFSVLINALDLSPNYASSLMGLGNGIAVVSGALSPYVVGVLTPNQTLSEWQSVFWIVSAIFLTTNLVYLIYGSGKVQEWNDPAFLNKKKIANVDEVKDGGERFPLNKN